MKIYKYNVLNVEGTLDDNTSLKDLTEKLNSQGQKGYRLHTAIPQVKEGTIVSTVLIFEGEDVTEECIIG